MDPQNYVYIDDRVPTTRSDGHFNMSAQEMNMLGVKNGSGNVKNGKRHGSLIANSLSPSGVTNGVRAVVVSSSGGAVVSTSSASEEQQHQGSDLKKGIIRTTLTNF